MARYVTSVTTPMSAAEAFAYIERELEGLTYA